MNRAIIAIDDKRGLADEKGIPWDLLTDRRYYRAKLCSGLVLMGYSTYILLRGPMDGRDNYVATRQGGKLRPGFIAVKDARQFLQNAQQDVWNIGGAGLITTTLDLMDQLFITRVEGDFHCTKFIPPFEKNFVLVDQSPTKEENGTKFRFEIWQSDLNKQG